MGAEDIEAAKLELVTYVNSLKLARTDKLMIMQKATEKMNIWIKMLGGDVDY